jgi:hypothetical protein
MITTLEPKQIFVFGSNTAGVHGAGAALQARKQFGAVLGVGEGMTGQTYAFPTLTANLKQVTFGDLIKSRERFYAVARENPDLSFLLTKVGCGLAGFPEALMRGIFLDDAERPCNVVLPEDWR